MRAAAVVAWLCASLVHAAQFVNVSFYEWRQPCAPDAYIQTDRVEADICVGYAAYHAYLISTHTSGSGQTTVTQSLYNSSDLVPKCTDKTFVRNVTGLCGVTCMTWLFSGDWNVTVAC
jgi:hypothetical protein